MMTLQSHVGSVAGDGLAGDPAGLQNCLAKAVYDNMAESPDELAFRKGDILTVLEQNTNGLEGWWLCSLRGRQGICPGNRLRLLAGMYDTGGTPPVHTTSPLNHLAKRRSCLVNPNKVVTPHKVGDVYLYDIPAHKTAGEEYDVPPTRLMPMTPQHQGILKGQESYDTPTSQKMAYDIPRSYGKSPSPQPPMMAYDVPKPSPSNKSDSRHDYDVPKQQAGNEYDLPESDGSAYDIPPSHHITVMDAYDVPPSHSIAPSNRSSGVSMLSTGSSAMSPSSSACSLTPSLSLSSLGGTGSNRSSLEQQHELYDIPPSEVRRVTNPEKISVFSGKGSFLGETYDVPGNNNPTEFYDTPPKPKPAMQPGMEGVYDVPPQVTKDMGKAVDEVDGKMRRLSTSSTESRDSAVPPFVQGKELPLELDAAMDTLIRLQQEVHSSITKLFGFVSAASWRRKDNLESKVYDIKLACNRLRTALQEFLDFAQGSLVNSARASDRTLCPKLAKLVRPLQDSHTIIEKTSQALEDQGWSLSKLMGSSPSSTAPDELDQLVVCARGLTEDVRQVASFIQGNSTLIFKRSQSAVRPPKVQERPLPAPPTIKGKKKQKEENLYENDTKDWIEDYDYVNLESKESVEKENEEIKAALPKELRKSFENILKESQIPVDNDPRNYPNMRVISPGLCRLDPNDRQVLHFYGAQVDTHITYLTNAIDAFLATIENNQPPKVFIGHSKFVVLSAHKLVYIGDTLHRNIVNTDVRNKVMLCSNSLCDALKTTVQCTKTAAMQFPSVIAVQDMVDSVVDISHSANDLKTLVTQVAKL